MEGLVRPPCRVPRTHCRTAAEVEGGGEDVVDPAGYFFFGLNASSTCFLMLP